MFTWFIHSLPSGFLLNVTLSREAVLYKIAIPWLQGQHPLPIPLLHCFHHHPIHYALTCVFIAGLSPLDYELHEGRQILERDLSHSAKRTLSEPSVNEWVTEFLLLAWSHMANLVAELRLSRQCLNVPFPGLHTIAACLLSFSVPYEPAVQATLIHSLLLKSNPFFSISSIRT